MKLISTLFEKKTLKAIATALFILMTTLTFAKTSSTVDAKTVFFNRFEAKVTNNTVELTWVVTEYNNKNFQVQHSLNGSDWEDITLIPSKTTYESLESYTYTINNSPEGKHYYRIKHTDIDYDKEGYSATKIALVKNEKLNTKVWANPATGEVRIINNASGSGLYTKATIFDLSGKIMLEKKMQTGVNNITINDLPVGIYLVSLETKVGAAYTQKIIKQ